MSRFIELMRREGLKLVEKKSARDHHAERVSLVAMARVMVQTIKSDVDRKIVVGMLTDGIFQREQIPTGLASVEANKIPAVKQTKEHFYGRRQSAVELVNMLSAYPSIDDDTLVAFLVERSQVHHVTKSQNMALRKYTMNNPTATWQESYAACGVVLVPRVGQKRGRKPKHA